MSAPSDFDWEAYLINNPDVAAVGCSEQFAVQHWKDWGSWEGRSYCRRHSFDWEDYLDTNPQLRVAGVINREQALAHFIVHGERTLRSERSKTRGDRKVILIVTHRGVGGSETYVQRCISAHPEIQFALMRCTESTLVKISLGKQRWNLDLRWNQESIFELMEDLGVAGVHISQLVGYPFLEILSIISRMSLPYIVTLHDYFLLSGNYLDAHPHRPWVHRKKIIELFNGAQCIVVPSEAVRDIYQKVYQQSQFRVVPHEILEYRDCTASTHSSRVLNVGIVGHIEKHKGRDTLSEAVEWIEKHGIAVHLWVFGQTYPEITSQCITVPGVYYRSEELQNRREAGAPDAFLIPGSWEETYSYVLSHMQTVGKPIFAPNLPVYEERNRFYKGAVLYPVNSSVPQIVERMTSELPKIVSKATIVHSVNPFYRELYVEWSSREPVSVADYKSFLAPRLSLMLEGVIDSESLRDRIAKHPEVLDRPEDVKMKVPPKLVFGIHQYLARQTLKLRATQTEVKLKRTGRTAVIVEPRVHAALESVVRNVMHYLGDRWDLHFFCSRRNAQRIRELFLGWEYHLTIMNHDDLDVITYSSLLMSEVFWNQIEAEHVLIFQTDSFILRQPQDHFEEFLKYSYVGAPHEGRWGTITTHTPKGWGLNGGFSLRRKSHALKCIREVSVKQIEQYRVQHGKEPLNMTARGVSFMAEDVFFCHAIEMLGLSVPPREVSEKFSVQDVYYPTAYAIHGYYHPYLSAEQIDEIIQQASSSLTMKNSQL